MSVTTHSRPESILADAPSPETVQDSQSSDGNSEVDCDRFWTIPNILTVSRLIGSGVLVGLALVEWPMAVLVLFVVLEMTDWFDGKLAIVLHQRTELGARLDSAADVALAAATLFAGLWLHWATLQPEFVWVGAAIGTYAASSLFGLWKFGQVPAYHTFGAKKCWGLITIGVVCVFGGWAVWPFRVAMIAVTLTNFEACLITGALREPRVDVLSLYHALRDRREPAAGNESSRHLRNNPYGGRNPQQERIR